MTEETTFHAIGASSLCMVIGGHHHLVIYCYACKTGDALIFFFFYVYDR